MELINTETTSKKLSFLGEGKDYFVIKLVNLLLSGLTLGLYYPWAKAASLKYLYEHTELDGKRFKFTGTGKEMFIGFIKAVGIILFMYILIIAASFSRNMFIMFGTLALFYVVFLLLIPISIHGSLRYRLARSYWSDVQFSYLGDRTTLIKEFFIGFILTLFTFGLYSSWFNMKIRTYITNHIRFGNAKFSFDGNGMDYFLLNLKGVLLSVFTLGIYSFWYYKSVLQFLANHTKLEQEGREIEFESQIEGLDLLVLFLTNILILLFSLGIGKAWVDVRTLKFFFERMEIKGAFDPASLVNIEDNFKDATGDDLADMLDINLV
ncbi:MAG: YjgN family protein [Bacteroidia bacterium]